MERVPREAWNVEGIKLILGDPCIVDRFERSQGPGDNSDLLTCWVWMEDPDELPRSLSYTIFSYRAGQAATITGLHPTPTRLPARPPIGRDGDRPILIHLTGYEDWSPSDPDSDSGTSSEHGSSGPRFVHFDWALGVLDGTVPQGRRAHPGGCRPPPSVHVRRNDDNDEDGNGRGPRPREQPPRTTTVRQLFRGCSSDRSVRVRTRSPPTYRQALMGEQQQMVRGRAEHRSPPRSAREREALAHASEDWERRRSRSPPRRAPCCNTIAIDDQLVHTWVGQQSLQPSRDFDPMLDESLGVFSFPGEGLQMPSPVYVPVSASFVPRSDLYNTNGQGRGSGLEDTYGQGRNAEDEILFGPGVQLAATPQMGEDSNAAGPKIQGMVDHQVMAISDRVTMMEIDQVGDQVEEAAHVGLIPEEESLAQKEPVEDVREEYVQEDEYETAAQKGCAAFCKNIFKDAAAPLLPKPAVIAGRKKVAVATRSSLRQAAKPSQVPVSQRAQQKLMRELQFIDTPKGAPDAAATEFIDLYGHDLTEKALEAISAAAQLGNKELVSALAALAAEGGSVEMEVA